MRSLWIRAIATNKTDNQLEARTLLPTQKINRYATSKLYKSYRIIGFGGFCKGGGIGTRGGFKISCAWALCISANCNSWNREGGSINLILREIDCVSQSCNSLRGMEK